MKRCGLPFVLLVGVLLAPSAQAAVVSGKVAGGRGMTMMALSPNGTAVRQALRADGRFSLKLSSSKGSTLQLVGRNGRYFGPVVLRRKGRSANMALGNRAAKLGTLRLRAGHAFALRPVPTRLLDLRRTVKTDARGKPIGAGRLGLVRSGRGALSMFGPLDFGFFAEGGDQPGADTDADGVPNTIDADDNGNLVLDTVDPTTRSSNGLFTTLYLGFGEALNVNAGALTAGQINAVLSGENRFGLIFFFDEGQFAGKTVSGAHVDCFTLVYCRRGNGTAILSGVSESSPSLPRGSLWTDYTPDGSGYPNLEHLTSHDGRSAWAASVQPRVGLDGIHPGDTYDVVFGTSTGPVSVPTSLAGHFVTTPALKSYASGAASGTVSYPVEPGAQGTDSNPIALGSGSVTLTFWRPQRAAIAGADSGQYTDMGHLRYGVTPDLVGVQQNRPIGCGGLYADVSSDLEPVPSSNDSFSDSFWPYRDKGDDAAPDATRTLSFSIDLAGCLQRAGVAPAGQVVRLGLTASSEPRPGGADRAVQMIAVRLPG